MVIESNKMSGGDSEHSDPRRVVYEWDHTGMPILVSGGTSSAASIPLKIDKTEQPEQVVSRKRKIPPNPPTWTWGMIPILFDGNTKKDPPSRSDDLDPRLSDSCSSISKNCSETDLGDTDQREKRVKMGSSNFQRNNPIPPHEKKPGLLLKNPLFRESCPKDVQTCSWNDHGLGILVPNPFYKSSPDETKIKPVLETSVDTDSETN